MSYICLFSFLKIVENLQFYLKFLHIFPELLENSSLQSLNSLFISRSKMSQQPLLSSFKFLFSIQVSSTELSPSFQSLFHCQNSVFSKQIESRIFNLQVFSVFQFIENEELEVRIDDFLWDIEQFQNLVVLLLFLLLEGLIFPFIEAVLSETLKTHFLIL